MQNPLPYALACCRVIRLQVIRLVLHLVVKGNAWKYMLTSRNGIAGALSRSGAVPVAGSLSRSEKEARTRLPRLPSAVDYVILTTEDHALHKLSERSR